MNSALHTFRRSLALVLCSAVAAGADRFPQPDFESGYSLPTPTHPVPAWADSGALLAVVGLVLCLALASYLALRRRSRKGLFGLALVSLLTFGFFREGCVCAVGSVQNIALALADSAQTVPMPVLAFFVLPLAAALLVGRTFCAAVCPLGAAQELVLLRPVKIPYWLDQALGMFPVIYLGFAVLLAATGAGFVVCRFDPFVPFFRLNGPVFALVLGGSVLVLSTVVGRPYCRFACPYGVLLNWASRLSKWHVSITPDECVRCRLCEDSCPYGAIRTPTPDQPVERRALGVTRLGRVLIALPLLAVAGGAVFRLAGPTLARLHPTVALHGLVQQASDDASALPVEVETFRNSGQTVPDLAAAAAEVRGRFRTGSMWLGAIFGLAFGLKLLRLSVKRTRDDYEPDRGACLSCGRCFDYCPKERVRRAASP